MGEGGCSSGFLMVFLGSSCALLVLFFLFRVLWGGYVKEKAKEMWFRGFLGSLVPFIYYYFYDFVYLGGGYVVSGPVYHFLNFSSKVDKQ